MKVTVETSGSGGASGNLKGPGPSSSDHGLTRRNRTTESPVQGCGHDVTAYMERLSDIAENWVPS